MTAGLHALRDDDVGAGCFGGFRFRDGGDGREPGDPARLHRGDEIRGIQPHDRGNHRRRGGQQRLALGREVGRCGVGGRGRYLRSKPSEEAANGRFMVRVAVRRRIGDPQIKLEGAVGLAAHAGRPGFDRLRRHQQRTAGAETPGIGDGGRQSRRRHARHRGEQNRQAQAETVAEGLGAGQWLVHLTLRIGFGVLNFRTLRVGVYGQTEQFGIICFGLDPIPQCLRGSGRAVIAAEAIGFPLL